MKKILIVEDDLAIKNELKKFLSNSGYEVQTLNNFTSSKEEAINSNADLILLDINIPYLNGEVLLKELRKETNIPVIMLTSRVNELDEALSISYGADDYITKPYNPTILLLRIQNIFKRIENLSNKLKYKSLLVFPSKGILKGDTKEILLTKNEMIIFEYLLSNIGTIVTRDDLMTNLWIIMNI